MAVACLVLHGLAVAQTGTSAGPEPIEKPTLYVVPYAHLDTQWRWDYVKTINEYIPNTMRQNFALFEKYPHYVFNFSGSNRYRMMKEYYPADYAKVKAYVAAGRWFPSGSSVEESDVNTPSAESLVRQILYGKQFFRRELGKTSAEYMLPDCFGFPASLPSILAHAGIKGFSTQKLTWKSAAPVGGPDSPERTPIGIPFNVGVWTGPTARA
jgi:alpha-mannosidase